MGFHFMITFLNQKTGEKEYEEFFSVKPFADAWQDALNTAIERTKEKYAQDMYWCLLSVADNNVR